MKPNWLEIKNSDDAVEIRISGVIGDYGVGDGTSELAFREELDKIPDGKNIIVSINSPGGYIADGLAIYNAIKAKTATNNVVARIDGYAASIASVIPLAAQKVISPISSIWMIHEPWSITIGNADDMLKAAEVLDKHADVIAQIYERETSLTSDEARTMMKLETWFDGREAVKFGFADETTEDDVSQNLAAHMPQMLSRYRVPEHIQNAIQKRMEQISQTNNLAIPPSETENGDGQRGGEAADLETAAQKSQQNAEQEKQKMEPQINNIINDAAPPAPIAPGCSVEPITLDLALRNNGCKTPADRVSHICSHWHELARHYPMLPQGANTDSTGGALVPKIIADQSITVLQNKLAPLAAFATNFSQNRSGRTPLNVPMVTAGGTAQTNPTNFEDTTNFVNTISAVTVTPQQVVAGAHLTNAEYQNGWTLRWVIEQKAIELADKIKALVNAQIDAGSGKFTAKNVGAAASFGISELREVWGMLKKASRKSVILDGEYYAAFLPADMTAFNPLQANTYPGWDGFFTDTNWTGAYANCVGFACHPQALAVAAALPLEIPAVPGSNVIREEVITLENVGLSIATYMWLSLSSRTVFQTWEVMFGVARADASAGIVLTSV